jgi:hypothetical protein
MTVREIQSHLEEMYGAEVSPTLISSVTDAVMDEAKWADTVHPIHKQFTVAEMLELERPHLMSMPVLFDGYVEKPARVLTPKQN